MKIAVAMSGGVDSSVTAALLVEQYGKENVFGVTMRLFCYGETEPGEKACCSIEAVNDARAVCDQIGIPHYALNMEKEFEEAVISDFLNEYKKGRTPIPCVLCNTIIKFEYLLNKVISLGATHLATGHYARIEGDDHGHQLLKGVDETKDQTYFLYGLTQEQLKKTFFPLGGMKKTEVRKEAERFGLKTAKKTESQGICFITAGRVTDWLRDKVDITPGKIVNTKGEVLGDHEGIIFYTVGQRKRIGGGHAEPMYVVKVDAAKNEVVIGSREELFGRELWYESAHFISGHKPKLPLRCTAKIRYNMDEMSCEILEEKAGKYKVAFSEPQRAITPGQSIVLYDGPVVIGGGVITNSA